MTKLKLTTEAHTGIKFSELLGTVTLILWIEITPFVSLPKGFENITLKSQKI